MGNQVHTDNVFEIQPEESRHNIEGLRQLLIKTIASVQRALVRWRIYRG